jgi:hypothetical protein
MNNDPQARVRDDDLRLRVASLDWVRTALTHLQADPLLRDEPAILNDLCACVGFVEQAADYLADLREERHG